MSKESMLGKQASRVKVDVRLPKTLAKQMEVMCKALGVPKNALVVLGVGLLLVELAPLLSAKKREVLVERVSKLFQRLLKQLKNQ